MMILLSACSGKKSLDSGNGVSSGTKSVRVGWTASSSSYVAWYSVEQSIGSSTTHVEVARFTAPATSGVITGLKAGATYNFRVRAVNAGGSTNPTSTASVAL